MPPVEAVAGIRGVPGGGAPVTAGGRGPVWTSRGPTGQRDGGRRHHAVDRSSFAARLGVGRGHPGQAASIRDYGPTAAGRWRAAVPQTVQGTDCLESPSPLIQPVMQSAFPGGGEPHIPASNRRRKTRGAPGLSVGLRRCPGYFGGRKGYGG